MGTLFGTNTVTADIFDTDDDRASDRRSLDDQQAGYLCIKDGDRDYPVVAWNNLLANGTFNRNGAGWTLYGSGNLGFDIWAAESGDWGLWIRENSQRGAYMDVSASEGKVYTFSVRARATADFDPGSCYIKSEIYDVYAECG